MAANGGGFGGVYMQYKIVSSGFRMDSRKYMYWFNYNMEHIYIYISIDIADYIIYVRIRRSKVHSFDIINAKQKLYIQYIVFSKI